MNKMTLGLACAALLALTVTYAVAQSSSTPSSAPAGSAKECTDEHKDGEAADGTDGAADHTEPADGNETADSASSHAADHADTGCDAQDGTPDAQDGSDGGDGEQD
jgi:hypothetical protein